MTLLALPWARSLCRSSLLLSTASVCCFSTSSNIVDQMLDYALRQSKTQHNQGIDVLRSGLTMVPEGSAGAGRLLAAMACIDADRSHWGDCLVAAQSAMDMLSRQRSVSVDAAKAYQQSACWAARALLVQGDDSQALSISQEAVHMLQTQVQQAGTLTTSHPLWQPYVGVLGTCLATQHAAGQLQEAASTANELQPLVEQGKTSIGALSQVAASSQALADWHTKQNPQRDMRTRYNHIAEAAAKGVEACKATSGAGMEERMCLEAQADAWMGAAQAAIAIQQWEDAEDWLGTSLTAAEALSADEHPRVAPILALLGYVYSRTGRVTFAEGMYRQAARLLHLDPSRPSTSVSAKLAHPSMNAAISWQFSQLLHALPKRETEATQWQELAKACWQRATAVNSVPLEGVLGGAEHLKGVGPPGSGLIASLTLMRMLSR